MPQEISPFRGEELNEKLRTLQVLEEELTELELELATLGAKLAAFEREYFRRMGSKYAELDRLQAELDALLALRNPSDSQAEATARQSQERAKRSAEETRRFEALPEEASKPFQPSAELKALYRQLAKLYHPDLAGDPEEQRWRTSIMQEVNEAYEHGDIERLRQILERGSKHAQGVMNRESPKIAEITREIGQAESRIRSLKQQIQALYASDLFVLYQAAQNESALGEDLFTKLNKELDTQLVALRERIRTLGVANP